MCFAFNAPPPRRLSVRDMFILPPRIGVNIRPALLYAVSVSQNILRTPHPPPRGARNADGYGLALCKFGITNTVRGPAANTAGGQRANNVTSESEIMGKKLEYSLEHQSKY